MSIWYLIFFLVTFVLPGLSFVRLKLILLLRSFSKYQGSMTPYIPSKNNIFVIGGFGKYGPLLYSKKLFFVFVGVLLPHLPRIVKPSRLLNAHLLEPRASVGRRRREVQRPLEAPQSRATTYS